MRVWGGLLHLCAWEVRCRTALARWAAIDGPADRGGDDQALCGSPDGPVAGRGREVVALLARRRLGRVGGPVVAASPVAEAHAPKAQGADLAVAARHAARSGASVGTHSGAGFVVAV